MQEKQNIPTHTEAYSIDNYIGIIKHLLYKGYSLEPFTIKKPQKKTVFLRHDIDYSLSWAETFAELNNKLKIAATFFIQLRSPLYNLCCYKTLDAIKRVGDLGQHIAFHLTLPDKKVTYEEVFGLLQDDYGLFQRLIPRAQPVFAWHNPSLLFDKEDGTISKDFPGYINVYGKYAGGEYPYFSDSNMRYTVGQIREIIDRDMNAFQLALAPMQWAPGKKDMMSVMAVNLIQKIKDNEAEFKNNTIYHACYPNGLPESLLIGYMKRFREDDNNQCRVK